ncbi:hypothetical protein ACFXA9_23155, partial [Streptomyces sp. NPDC059411]
MPVVSERVMEWTRLLVLDLVPGEVYAHECGESEWIVLPLSGSCEVRCAEPFPHPAPSRSAELRLRRGRALPGPGPQTPDGLDTPA